MTAGYVDAVGFMMTGGFFVSFMLTSLRTSVTNLGAVDEWAIDGITGVSIAGGVMHNVAQICLAALVVQNRKLFYYLPVLLVAGVITGMLIGILSDRIFSAVKREGRKSSSQ